LKIGGETSLSKKVFSDLAVVLALFSFGLRLFYLLFLVDDDWSLSLSMV